MISIVFALLAGIVTIAAPCTLPVLPILLGSSLAKPSRSRPVFMALGFIATFAAFTLVFNVVATVFGLDPDQLRTAAIGLLLVFGLLMVWPGLYHRISPSIASVTGGWTSSGSGKRYDGAIGGFVLGTTLGLVWTPCAGPVLGSILTLLSTQASPAWSATLLFCYAIGAAIPMMAIAYGGQYAVKHVRNLTPYTERLQQAFGVLVVGFAVAMFFQYDVLITAWLANYNPAGQLGL
jgi:cytochrome c-type biogenesis protein